MSTQRPLRVDVHSNNDYVYGRVSIDVRPDDSVRTVIANYCSQLDVAYRDNLRLRDDRNRVLGDDKTAEQHGIEEGDQLYITIQGGGRLAKLVECGCNRWWLTAVLFLATGAIGTVVIALLKVTEYTNYEYGVVFDAGSSHTTMYLYRWQAAKYNGTAVAHQVASCTVNGSSSSSSLSSFASRPSSAGASLDECLLYARAAVLRNSPTTTTSGGSTVTVWLGATAGMRLLRRFRWYVGMVRRTCSTNVPSECTMMSREYRCVSVQFPLTRAANETISTAIMSSVRQTLAGSGFSFSNPLHQARIIEGTEEAEFSWITVNYLSAKFISANDDTKVMKAVGVAAGVVPGGSHQPSDTIGSLDLGGASTQIAFETAGGVGNIGVRLFSRWYEIYAHSFLCYGVNEARRRYLAALVERSGYNTNITDPCLPATFGPISMSYADIFEVPCTKNRSTSARLHGIRTFTFWPGVNLTTCQRYIGDTFDWSCKLGRCSYDNITIPASQELFMAFSAYFYIARDIDALNGSIDHFASKAANHCLQPTSARRELCFNSHYTLALLTAYGFNSTNWSNVQFQEYIQTRYGRTELGWTLGYLLLESNHIASEPDYYHTYPIGSVPFALLLLLFVSFIVVSICMACQAKKINNRTRNTNEQSYGSISTYTT